MDTEMQAPPTFIVDAYHAELAGFPEGEWLIRWTEFGVSLAHRRYHTDTWSPPALADRVTS